MKLLMLIPMKKTQPKTKVFNENADRHDGYDDYDGNVDHKDDDDNGDDDDDEAHSWCQT